MARRLMNRRALVALTAVAAIGLATGFVVVQSNGDDAEAQETEEVAATTAQVERRTLTETETVEGILDFGEAHSVTASGNGILTTVAGDDSVVKRGEELFSVNLRPTVLLYGEIPFYRDLQEGMEGQDVMQLQENLIELGFTDDGSLKATGEFDTSTGRAVEAWQESLGQEETGIVTTTDVVFLPESVRVASSQPVGSLMQPGAQVVEYTSTSQEVRVDLELAQGDLAEKDDSVTVALPDGTELTGTVEATVHSAASSDSGSGDDGSGADGMGGGGEDDGAAEPTVEVTISLDDTSEAEEYVSATVDVIFVRSETEDALTVPVTALLAVEGGGFAVELPGGAADEDPTLVEVEPGVYADGYVEVSGDIQEGDEVVVPA